MRLSKHLFKILSLYFEARIRIRIKVKGRIRTRINVTSRIRKDADPQHCTKESLKENKEGKYKKEKR
jgi:hypothetical protein